VIDKDFVKSEIWKAVGDNDFIEYGSSLIKETESHLVIINIQSGRYVNGYLLNTGVHNRRMPLLVYDKLKMIDKKKYCEYSFGNRIHSIDNEIFDGIIDSDQKIDVICSNISLIKKFYNFFSDSRRIAYIDYSQIENELQIVPTMKYLGYQFIRVLELENLGEIEAAKKLFNDIDLDDIKTNKLEKVFQYVYSIFS
jgi:hypothetical protein